MTDRDRQALGRTAHAHVVDWYRKRYPDRWLIDDAAITRGGDRVSLLTGVNVFDRRLGDPYLQVVKLVLQTLKGAAFSARTAALGLQSPPGPGRCPHPRSVGGEAEVPGPGEGCPAVERVSRSFAAGLPRVRCPVPPSGAVFQQAFRRRRALAPRSPPRGGPATRVRPGARRYLLYQSRNGGHPLGTSRDQAVTLDLSAPDFGVDRVESLTLSMRANLPPTGVVRVRYDAPLTAALGVCGAAVSVRVALPAPVPMSQQVFTGTVSDAILGDDGAAVLTVVGKSAHRDETVRVRSFGTGPARVAIKSLTGIAELLAGVGNSARLTMPVAHLYQFGRTDYEVLQQLAGWHGLYLREDPAGALILSDGADGAAHLVPREAIAPRSTTLHVHKRAAAARCVSTDLLAEKTPARPAAPAAAAPPGAPLAAAAHALGVCRPHDLYGGGAGLTDAERAGRVADAARTALASWRAVLTGPLATQVRVGDRLKLLDNEVTDMLLVRGAELTYAPVGHDPLALTVDAVPVGPLGGGPASATPGPVVAVIGTALGAPDQTGRAWVRVAFPWHDPGDGIWCPVAQATASKPGRGAVEVPAAGEAVVALLDPAGFDPPAVLGAVYRGPGGGRATTGGRRTLHASPGMRVEVDQEAGAVTVQGKAIRLLGPVTILGTLDVTKGGEL